MGFKFDTVRTIVSELGTKTANFLKHEQPANVLKQSAGNKPLFCHEYCGKRVKNNELFAKLIVNPYHYMVI